MSRGVGLPAKKTSSCGLKVGISRKDEIFNGLLDDLAERGIGFPRSTVETDGSYFVQVLTNALWYITSHHFTINQTALKKTKVLPVPLAFAKYEGFNELKRKKMKCHPLSCLQLHSHSQALYSLLLRPLQRSTDAWSKLHEDVSALADCLSAYEEHLKDQAATQQNNRSLDHPVRTIAEHATVEHRPNTICVSPIYQKLDDDVSKAHTLHPVFFNEILHLETPFKDPVQRYRYLKKLQLSVPVDLIRFCPGGSIVTTVCIVKVEAGRSVEQMLTQSARLFNSMKANFKEIHTRLQKEMFADKLKNIVKIQPSVVELIYKELAMDGSQSLHPETHERLRLIFLGEPGLLADLRHLNAGRPTGRFDVFFEKLASIVDKVTAADERRHNIAHMSEWISLNELVKQAEAQCPENTPIPSTSLVRLQFAPRNPYAHSALNFTSKLEVQYKIQRRQLRVSHEDDHYCAALLKYLKHRMVTMRDKARLFFTDDKAKIPIGEPGVQVSTGVRGKMTIAPTSTTLASSDHDMNKASLTPSVILDCNIPTDPEKSFVRGQVIVTVKDSVFQSSNPFRHAAELTKVLEATPEEHRPKCLAQFTDGGTDHRNTLVSVQCAAMCLFWELNLDMLILARCAPGHSWTNPAERVMYILNLGLQNCALERRSCSEEAEKKLKPVGSMAGIRSLAEKHPEIKQEWCESVEQSQSTVRNRFLRLQLKDVPFQAIDPAADDNIKYLQRHLGEHFPNLDVNKLKKTHVSRIPEFTVWQENHCRLRQYSFQIRKCKDASCCTPPSLQTDEMQWLPDPMLDETGEHYLKYSKACEIETDESDRPTLKSKTTKSTAASKPKVVPVVMEDTEQLEHDASLFTTQNARAVNICIECRKPRVIYSKTKLSQRQQLSLALMESEYDYTCGSRLAPPNTTHLNKVQLRRGLTCKQPVEIQYYSSDLGRKDLCCFCVQVDVPVDVDLKKLYKTVLPICQSCRDKGTGPVVMRPFGKRK